MTEIIYTSKEGREFIFSGMPEVKMVSYNDNGKMKWGITGNFVNPIDDIADFLEILSKDYRGDIKEKIVSDVETPKS